MNIASHKDELFSALSVVLLLIGTATGSARAMLAMSAISLTLMAVFYRTQMKSGALFVAAAAAVTAMVVALVIMAR
jgi:predicted membrane-bound mannosyltransferase